MRDLYKIGFNPVLPLESFFHAKDGFGKTPADIAVEQPYVSAADYIIFAYPNWHDSPNAITKGYMERVFSKQFAYRDTDKGLEGLLKGKCTYTIMNAGWVGQGRGDVGRRHRQVRRRLGQLSQRLQGGRRRHGGLLGHQEPRPLRERPDAGQPRSGLQGQDRRVARRSARSSRQEVRPQVRRAGAGRSVAGLLAAGP